MEQKTKNIKVAILIADGFQQDEMTQPKKALEEAGAQTVIVSPVKGKVKGWKNKNWAEEFSVELELDQADAEEFDALLLPGGVINPDTLRMNPTAIKFIKSFVLARKPIAAICHGPWPLIDAGAVRNKTMTSWPSIKADLTNAGAHWVDEEIVEDEGLITSRKPDDIPAFNRALIELLSKK